MGIKEKKAWADFYDTPKWRKLRSIIIAIFGSTCFRCGKKNLTGMNLHVDHIVSRRADPRRMLDPTNLQILCKECNCDFKGIQCIDYRTPEHIKLLEDNSYMFENYKKNNVKIRNKLEERKQRKEEFFLKELILPEVEQAELSKRVQQALYLYSSKSMRKPRRHVLAVLEKIWGENIFKELIDH